MTFSPKDLGDRIRALRKDTPMTLAELSARSGVAVSTLSKVENGVAIASIDTVFKISRGLGVMFDNLIEVGHPNRTPARRVVTRARRAENVPTVHYDYMVHAADLVDKQMIPLLMRVKTREAPAPEDWSTHPGEEFVLVLRGTVEVRTEIYAPVRLEAGDSTYFDSLMRHCFIAIGSEEPLILSMCLSDHAPLQARLEEARRRLSDPAARERRSRAHRVPAAGKRGKKVRSITANSGGHHG